MKKYRLLVIGLLGFYLITHLIGLVELPVFADESIYIRWSQLIIDDWQRYLFFPLNDGKTPLHMWLLVPFQFIAKDQLLAGRLLSVVVGFAQVVVAMQATKLLGGKKKAQLTAGLLTTILPFWYFHHRMALIDGLLTLFISLIFIGLFKIVNRTNVLKGKKNKLQLGATIFSGCMFGLALLTKIPAILTLLVFPLLVLLIEKPTRKKVLYLANQVGVISLIGIGLFVTLKIHPAFGQLFSRGNDFLYPTSQVLLHGVWKLTIVNLPTYVSYFAAYLTLPVLAIILVGTFVIRKRQNWFLLLAALFWAAPIMLLGKVVYPRYLFPISFFLTVSAALSVEDIMDKITNIKNLSYKFLAGLVMALLMANAVAFSVLFMYYSMFNSDQIPFVKADKVQYLHEWSSGHGIYQTYQLLIRESQDKKIAVATEGFFGTLPDGLLMYLHRQNVNNIWLEGIGQPVGDIPDSFIQKTTGYDQIWLVANSHRITKHDEADKLIAEYCRPDNAPCLQVWDITDRE